MHCFKCGSTLPPGVATCPACGEATPYNVTTSTPEAFSAQSGPAVPDNSGEEQAPPPVVSAGRETPQVERTVLQQAPQQEVAESQSVERTVLQEPPAQGTPAPQAVVERTVLQQPSQPVITPSGPAQQPGSPQPTPPSSSPAWQQPQPMQGQQPGPSQPLPGQQAQPGAAQPQQGPSWPQPFPGQQSPQQGPWQPQQGPSQPLPWQQLQQPWPQPFPGQPPQQGPWQPQPGMPQQMPWPQPQQQGQPWAQPFPGQQLPQQGPWQPQPGMPQPFPGQQGQPAAPQSYPAWQQPGAVQPQQAQPWPQSFPAQPPPAVSQPLPGQPWPQPFPGQPQFQPSPAWQQPQMGVAQPAPVQQAFQAASAPVAQALPTQQAPQRQGLSLERILSLIIIALVIIGGSGLIYYMTAGHSANLRAQATSVAQDFLTAQARFMSPQGIYNQAIRGKPVIDDSLSNSARSTWQNTNSFCTFTQGALHITGQANFIYFCHSSRQFSNFAFQVQVTIIKGNNGGIVFRANESPLLHYLFGINTNGFYTLDVLTNDALKLLNYGPSAAIRTGLGQSNLLTVIARGSTIYLYINKQFVGSANDTTFRSGEVGMFASSYAGPADIAFNNAQVWKL